MNSTQINQRGLKKVAFFPFARNLRQRMLGIKLVLLFIAAMPLAQSTFATNLFWDINGATAGSGGSSPAGIWDTTISNWSTNSAGTNATIVWTDGNTAIFSAGNDATGSYSITLSGAQTPGAVTFASGIATLSGGTLTLTNSGVITVNASPVKGIISSVISGSVGLTKLNTGELVLAGANIFSGNLSNQAGTVTLNNSSAAGSGSIVFNPLGGNTAVLTSSNASINVGNNISLSGGLSATVEIDPATNNTLTLSGVLSGSHNWAANGLGTLRLNGSVSNTFTGALSVKQGTVVVAAHGALSPGNVNGTVVNNGATLALDGVVSTEGEPLTLNGAGVGGFGVLQSLSGQNSIGGNITLNSDSTIGAFGGSTLVLSAPIVSSGTANLTITNSGRVALEGSSYTYSNTLVASGTLEVDNPANAGNGLVTVSAGAVLTGSGSAPGGVVLSGTIAPVGIFSSGSQTWQGGGKYVWEIADAIDTFDNDLISISTGLTNNATSGNKFTISIVSLDPNNFQPGVPGDFDNTQQYDWIIASTTSGITGFNASKFTIDASAFASSLGGGSFRLLVSGNNLVVEFDPAPVISCPSPIGQGNDLNNCSASVTFAATATNYPNLSPVTIVYKTNGVTVTSPWVFPKGTTTVVSTATDTVGDTAVCSFTVTVNDAQPPTITAPAALTDVHTDPGQCYATAVSLGTPVVGDNCGVAGVSNNAPTMFPHGNTTVTWTVTDTSGNQTSATQLVTVIDHENPTITAPAALTDVHTDPGQCYATSVSLGTPITGDNCAVAAVTNDAPAQFPHGNTTVTWTVTDTSGNLATATQLVTVRDHQAPTVLTKNITIQLDASGNASITSTQVDNGSFDNCLVTNLSVNPSNFNCANIGTNPVTLTVTDSSGNQANAPAVVTVQDVTPPIVVFNTISVQLDATGNYTLSASDLAAIAAGSSDSCGIALTNVTPSTFTYCDTGSKFVTLTLTDVSGNSVTTNGNITVLAPLGSPAVVYVDTNYTGSCAPVTFPFSGSPGAYYVGYNAFPTIQAGVNAVVTGGTVNVAAGNYAEAVAISRKLNLVGAGVGTNPASATIVNGGGSSAITLTAGGAAANDRLALAHLQLTGLYGVYIDSTIGYVTLNDVAAENCPNYGIEFHNSANVTDIQLTGCFLDNCNIGLRKATTALVNGLSIVNGTMSGNVEGIYAAQNPGVAATAFSNITINGTVFNGDSLKGIYVEALSQALFENLVFSNCGTIGGSSAGININLKYGDYQNVEITNCSFTGCGTGDPVNGGGIVIEARGTGTDSSYSANPATLAGVTLGNLSVNGSLDGIRLGEPGKNNVGPTGVTIVNCNLAGNTGNGIHNDTLTTTIATGNWWGDASGPANASNPGAVGAAVTGSATFSPWLGDGSDTQPGVAGFQPNSTPVYYTPHHLAFSTQPGAAGINSPFSSQPVVQVIDSNGGLDTVFHGAVAIAIGNNPSGGILSGGLLTQPVVSGVATFSGLQIDKAGAGYTLVASSASPIILGTSAGFDIANPLPAIASLSPARAVAGDPGFTVTVSGTNFVYNSVVRWNGSDRPTTYSSPSQVSATITAGDIASAGTSSVTVFNVTPGGGESTPATSFTIYAVPPVVYVNSTYTSNGSDDGHLWGYDAFNTVQAGVNRVAPGGTVNVAAGTYVESVNANKSVTLLGANQGVAGCGSRGPASVINGGGGNAVTIAADNVAVDGFDLIGAQGVQVIGYAGAAIHNNVIGAGAVGVNAENISTTTANLIVANNCITLGSQVVGGTPTFGLLLVGVSGTQSPLIQGNGIQGAFYGYVLQGLNAGVPTLVQGGTVSGAMQGVAVLNLNPITLSSYASSSFRLDGISISGFTGNWPSLPNNNIQAGVYVFTSGSSSAAEVTGTITNVTIIGTGKISPDSAGLDFADFSTGAGVRQQITVQNSIISTNANRGIFVSGANATANISGSSIVGNGFDPYGAGGNPGFGIIARNNSLVTVSQCFVANPVVQNSFTVTALGADANTTPLGPTLTVSDSSIVDNGNGNLASQDAGTLNASGNWWGSASDTTIASLITGTVDFTPYLDSGTDTDAIATGFQGDLSALHVTMLGTQTGPAGRIQEGINLIADGSLTGGSRLLDVKSGTYSEINNAAFTGILVNKPLTMSSSSGAASTIISNTMMYMLEIDAPNVTINGFTVTDPNYSNGGWGGDGTGIYIDPWPPSDLSNIHIENCVVHDLGDRYVGIFCSSGPNLEINGCTIYNINGYTLPQNFLDYNDLAFGILVSDAGQPTATVSIHDNNLHDIFPRNLSVAVDLGDNVSNADVSRNQITLNSACTAGILLDTSVVGPVSITSNTISGSTSGLMLQSPFAQTATGNIINGAATSIYVLNSAATLKNNSASVGSGVGIWASGSSAKALVEANTLVGDSVAAIKVDGGAIVDAGDCAGGNVTGLGTGSGSNGSSAGGNSMTGYGFDGAAPWAIENLNSGSPAVLAYQNTYGAVVGNSLASLFTGNVLADQTGALLLQLPANLTFQCLFSVPPGATDFAGFGAQGGVASTTAAGVTFVDTVVSNTPNNRIITRTYTVTDACSQASCVQTITVNDSLPPVVTTWPTNRTLDVNGQCQVMVPNLVTEVVATDNCVGYFITQNPPAGTWVSLGTTNVTVVVADNSTNSVSTNVMLTIIDAQPAPVATFVDQAYANLAAGTVVKFPYSGAGADHYVGCDAFVTIQAGINRVASAGTVKVAVGTYPEVLLLNKSLALLGAQAGHDANTRFIGFVPGANGPKADPTLETVITAAATAPGSAGNDSVHIMATGVTIDGFVVDGNNAALPQGGAAVVGGINTDSRRAIETEDASGVLFSANNATIKNNIIQNYAQRGVELANVSDTSFETSGSLISGNVICNFGLDGILLANNAYSDVISNTVNMAALSEAGIWMQDSGNPGTGTTPSSIEWSHNTITVCQDAFAGLWVNLFHPSATTINIHDNTVNAATGVTGDNDFTYGIYLTSIEGSTTVTVTNNLLGTSGGQFARGIALWNLPTTTNTTVAGGTVSNAVIGVSLSYDDENFNGAGASSAVNISGVNISGASVGMLADATGSGSFSVQVQISGNTVVNACTTGISVVGTKASAIIRDNNASITGNAVGISVDSGAALLQNNDLTGNSLAGISVTNGAIVDAGSCTVTNATGLGTSTGGNNLSGYGFDNASPWAIINGNTGGAPIVLADHDNFGAVAGNNIPGAFSGAVEYAQSPAVITTPIDLSLVCASSIPAAATNLSGFITQGGYYSAGNATVSSSDDTNFLGSGVIHRTYTITDGCGVGISAVQTITVSDTVPPMIVALPTLNFSADSGQCSKSNVTWMASASDNCAVASVVSIPASGSTFSKGTNTVTVIASDYSGNAATNMFTVVVSDTEAPHIAQCATNRTVNADATAHASLPSLIGEVLASDNCDVPVITQIPPAGTVVGLGAHTVMLWAADTSGNSNACSATVTVIDVTAPVLTTPANVTVTILQDKDPYATGTATATDAGGSVTITYNDDRSGLTNCDSTGAILRTWTAVDPANNTTNSVQTITVIDNKAPYFTFVPADFTLTNDPGNCSAVVNYAQPTALDTGYLQGFEDANWVSGDAANNPSTDWNDDGSHVARAASGTGGIVSYRGNAHAVIDSTTARLTDSTGAFSRLGGYSSVFGTGYRVAQQVYVNLGDSGVVNATATNGYTWDLSAAVNGQDGGNLRDFVFHAAAYDASGVVIGADNSSEDSVLTRGPDLRLANHVTLTNSGWYEFAWNFRNTNNVLAADLQVRDSGSNVLFTQTLSAAGDLISTVAGGHRYLWFTFINADQLAIDHTVLQRNAVVSQSLASGYGFPVGTTTVTNTAADACGNSTNTTFTVTVNDVEPPSANVPANVVRNNDPGVCGAVVTFTLPAQTDNCGISNVAATPASTSTFPVGITPVTVVVTDIHNNSATNTFTVTVNDVEPPSANVPANIVQNNDPGACGAVVTFTLPAQTDNCAVSNVVATPASGSTFAVGTNTVSLVVTDIHNNTNTNSFTVTVIDAQPPVINSLTNLVQGVDAGQNYATVNFSVGATDNCGVQSVIATPPSAHQFPVGTNTVNVLATDIHGNTTSASFTVTVIALPQIVSGPMSRTNNAGTTATFTVTASSPVPISYQWFKGAAPLSDGGNISGATNATLTITSVSDADVASYKVQVSNLAGSLITSPATLTVIDPPLIVSITPASQTNNASTTATFSVNANGTAPFTYQWSKITTNATNVLTDVGNILGSTSNVLTISNLLSTDQAQYAVTVSNPAGSATTNGTLVVIDPAILVQPVSVITNQGGSATFVVVAAGTAPLMYQWMQNNIGLPGQTGTTLTLTGLQDSDEGSYTVIVSNSVGQITSAPATLALTHPPVIITQPASRTNNVGTTATFTVSVNGTTPFTFQWEKNGNNISGATNKTLVLNNVTTADDANYQVAITNSDGQALSAAATLTIIVPPAITSQPAGLTNNAGTMAVFSTIASGTSPAYQWFKITATATNALSDSNNVSGSRSNTLTLTNVLGADDGYYYLVASNQAGIAVSSNAILVVIDPIITSEPVGITVNLGNSASFSVGAYGTSPQYQWYKNGTNIAGANASTYTIAAAADSDQGNYTVVVTNIYGTATSTPPATLIVIDPPVITSQPASRTNNAGTTATFSVGATGTSPSYQWYKGVSPIGGANTATLTLLNVQDADAASYSVVLSNAAGVVTSTSATLTVIDAPVITSQPSSRTNNATSTATFTVAASGTTPFVYQWYKITLSATNALTDTNNIFGSTSNILTITDVLAVDAANYAVTITNAAGIALSSNAQLVVIDPVILVQPVGLTNFDGSTATFAVTAAGTPGLNYQWYQDGVALFGDTNSSLTLTSLTDDDAGNYTVIVTNSVGSVTSAPAVLVTVAPLITTQPTNVAVVRGGSASFSVSVNGQTPFQYQWLFNGTNLSGATNRIIAFSNVQTNSAGGYQVIVSNPIGIQTSQVATLTVAVPPAITVQPTNVIAVSGQTASFGVTASGTPLDYQWYFNSTNLPFATNSTLTLNNVSTNSSGVYYVTVTNIGGAVASSNVTLTVYSTAAPQLILVTYIDNQATVQLTGVPTYKYSIQTSSNLHVWIPLVTNVSPFTYTDTNEFGRQYYRGHYEP